MPAKSGFISHSTHDDSYVRELRRTLESLGVDVWADTHRLSPGDVAEQAYQRSMNITVQLGNLPGQAPILCQIANMNLDRGRPIDAVRFYRQAAEIYASAGDPQHEGHARNGIASTLLQLNQPPEARRELARALECKKPFGHSAEPWTTFAILTDLERATGDLVAAQAARRQAIDAYLAYRRDGGHPQYDTPPNLRELIEKDPTAARAAIDNLDLPYPYAAEIILALGD